MKTSTWMFLAALGVGGCGSSMMDGPDEMRSMLDGLRQEAESHLVDATAVTTMDGMRTEMRRHDLGMSAMMGDMESMMAGMSHCGGAGMNDLRDMHDAMISELGGHQSVIAQLAELPPAKAEVTRHVDAMRGMLDDMRGATAQMGCRM